MTREGLIEAMARAQARSAWDRSYRSDPNFSELYLTRWPGGVEEYLEQKWPLYVPDVRASLAAIEAAGVRLVPVAITPLIGWHLESNLATCNPPSEIHAANWRDAWAAAVAASPYAPQKDESHE